MRKHGSLFALALACALSLPAQENFELGRMWTFENAPLEHLKKTYGFEATPEWLDKVRLASLRMASGCSASFVSPKGLVMTNHHCVRGFVAGVSPKDQDWVKSGYYAKTPADEVRLPECVLQQLVAMKDVTSEINDGVQEGTDTATVARTRQKNHQRVLEDAKAKDSAHEHQIVTLFNGAQFQLYSYQRYDDVRLVCAPALQSAHFGGDPDNFVYPRYCLDFSFVRVYVDGKPADTKDHYFKWSAGGLKEGDLVFVTGNPGQTNRLKTLAQLEYMRDVQYPIRLQELDNQIEIYKKHMAKDPKLEQQLRTQVLGQENSQKAFRGFMTGLRDPQLMGIKAKAEAAFRAKIDADPALKAQYGDVWDRLAEIAAQRRELQPKTVFQTAGNSSLLNRALALVAAVSSKDSRAKSAAMQAAQRSLPPRSALGVELLTDTLVRAQEHLGKDDPFLSVLLAGEEPKVAVESILKSRLYDDKLVEELAGGNLEALKAEKDRVLQAALVVMPLMGKNQALAQKLQAEEGVLGARIGQALFAVYGTKISPDATFTLRLADGVVKGYPCNGSLAPWRTTFYGMYARNVEFDNKHPFDLPQEWLDRKGSIDMSKPLDFVSTNDIIGGNSGSPVVDKNAHVVGLIFDGNIESLPNNFLFRDDIPRSVSVHTEAILEALLKVLDAAPLAEELRGKA